MDANLCVFTNFNICDTIQRSNIFDGVYKILKYKVQIDSENHFKEIKKNDAYAKKQLKSLITFMQKISIRFDNKKVFELDRIERYVKLKIM